MPKPFTAEDVQAAHDQLYPTVQKLIDRFGEAQAFEILVSIAHEMCPDGCSQVPEYHALTVEKPVH
jgi:hypothetical protein